MTKDKFYIRQTTNRLFNIWRDMIRRCENPKRQNYKWYGAKGITVCEEWHDFDTFVKWALSSGYKDNLTIDRIDNSKNYEPSNCRWLNKKEQCRHRTSNILITYKGETHTLVEWCEITGINPQTMYNRYHKNWEVEKMLFTKPIKHLTK